MKINLNQLRSFYLAAKFKSVSKAAELLFVTPSAVTMQIKKLEHWAGFRLLIREGNSLKLTQDGMTIYAQATKVFQEAEALENIFEKMMTAHANEVIIGSHHILAKYILPNLIVLLKKLHPNLNVKMILDTVPNLLEKLQSQEIDFVLSASLPQGPDLKKIHLFSEELALVALHDSKLIEKKKITPRDIGSIPLLLQERNIYIVDEFIKKEVGDPNVVMDNISADVIKQFIHQDIGSAILMRFTVQNELKEAVFQEIEVDGGLPVADFVLAYLDEKNFSEEVQELTTSLKKYLFSRKTLIQG
ncbi:LysR family transcriptional regulator [Maridesulfovibrio sp.]|uniref:LysR family transcriptional regulator n=1 Tax=Maridesulfovibrio sp. TaxID=2795000 RepID=UPI0029F55DEC|nr:LysR family transcriptional regulator [Maridesulfovibrio sp.]